MNNFQYIEGRRTVSSQQVLLFHKPLYKHIEYFSRQILRSAEKNNYRNFSLNAFDI